MDKKKLAYNWAFHIDIEGFSNKFKKDPEGALKIAFNFIGNIKKVINRIDILNNVVSFSAVQYGLDGFLISQRKSYYNDDLSLPVACAICIMRLAIANNYVCRTQFSYGKMVSYTGEMNSEVISSGFSRHIVNCVGSYGDAIVNTYKLKGSKGPLFIIDRVFKEEFEKQNIYASKTKNNLYVNWLTYSDNGSVDKLWQAVNESSFTLNDLKGKMHAYIKENDQHLKNDWKQNALFLIYN